MNAMVKELNRWRMLWASGKTPVLARFYVDRETVAIMDTRSCAVEDIYIPSPPELALLELCERPRRRCDIPALLSDSLPNMIERHFIIHYEDRLVTLVTEPDIVIRMGDVLTL